MFFPLRLKSTGEVRTVTHMHQWCSSAFSNDIEAIDSPSFDTRWECDLWIQQNFPS